MDMDLKKDQDASLLPQSRAWYGERISRFYKASPNDVTNTLVVNSVFPVLQTQRDAWFQSIEILRSSLIGIEGSLYLEFNIPRMGKRVDAVVISGATCIVIEFKVGQAAIHRQDIDQAWDYALDLKNFHKASHDISIVPILVATEADIQYENSLTADKDDVYRPICVGRDQLQFVISHALQVITGYKVEGTRWAAASYCPTPTIIESARALYAQHSVKDIARNDAGAQNLSVTTHKIDQIVDSAIRNGEKAICFVTGVPGAGKTLVGLNVATRHRRELNQPTHAVYLSGNGPLVEVLHEALTRDEYERRKLAGEKVRKGEVKTKVKAFIQNVHHFRDEALLDHNAPADHVVIFDEAQRAWNLEKTSDFMKRRKGKPDFNMSEPEFLISYLDRHEDWAVIVCLVGGGQEINTGEAGIDTWLDAVNNRFPHWHAYISSRLIDTEYSAGKAVDRAAQLNKASFEDSLHLAVSMRSFRAENVSSFVKALLSIETERARHELEKLSADFPIVITRSLDGAKDWVRSNARGSERYGILASSKAQRLKPYAIDIRFNVNPVHWFLNDRDDTRSSYYMEDVATEFQAQGLELDWACIAWDGDLRYSEEGWGYHDFRGNRWCNVKSQDNQRYLLNAYRVLLTRARQGMVIFIPEGNSDDPTRASEYYESTFSYLREVGIPVLGH